MNSFRTSTVSASFLLFFVSCGVSPKEEAQEEQSTSVESDSKDSADESGETGSTSGEGEPTHDESKTDQSHSLSSSNQTTQSSEPTTESMPRKSFVDFVAVYEPGSAWEQHPSAKQAVEEMFAQFEATLKTSGDWDAEIEVYFTDDNTQTANVRFNEAYSVVDYEGKKLKVTPAWKKIVLNAPDDNGSGKTDGSSADFIMHFNVSGHLNNPGLVRHEIMHGLGAVSTLVRPVMDASGELVRKPIVGQRWIPGPYELRLVDDEGKPLLEDYDPSTQTYAIRDFTLKADLDEWKQGHGGISFRGIDDNGGVFEMPCMTFPSGDEGQDARVRYEEPRELMSARFHPTWHELSAPDRAFLRAIEYKLRDDPET